MPSTNCKSRVKDFRLKMADSIYFYSLKTPTRMAMKKNFFKFK